MASRSSAQRPEDPLHHEPGQAAPSATDAQARQTRTWGYWTQHKLTVLDEYLRSFVKASTKAHHRIYLDAFAGQGLGVDRLTGKQFEGSARLALAVNNPPFTHYRYFELPAAAAHLDSELHTAYPDRDIRVYAGDCNRTVLQALKDLRDIRPAPAFAFLDPDGMELSWDTITAIAAHKHGLRNKVEQWMLFPSQGLVRTLALQRDLTTIERANADRLFGSDAWEAVYQRRLAGYWTPQQTLEGYVDLLRWQLERTLGYRTTLALEMNDEHGRPLYHMIFATDHPAGKRIMMNCYTRAIGRAPALRNHIRSERQRRSAEDQGQYDIFGGEVPLEVNQNPYLPPDRMLAGRPPDPPRRLRPQS